VANQQQAVSQNNKPQTDDKNHYQAMPLATNGSYPRVAIVISWVNGPVFQTRDMKKARTGE